MPKKSSQLHLSAEIHPLVADLFFSDFRTFSFSEGKTFSFFLQKNWSFFYRKIEKGRNFHWKLQPFDKNFSFSEGFLDFRKTEGFFSKPKLKEPSEKLKEKKRLEWGNIIAVAPFYSETSWTLMNLGAWVGMNDTLLDIRHQGKSKKVLNKIQKTKKY